MPSVAVCCRRGERGWVSSPPYEYLRSYYPWCRRGVPTERGGKRMRPFHHGGMAKLSEVSPNPNSNSWSVPSCPLPPIGANEFQAGVFLCRVPSWGCCRRVPSSGGAIVGHLA